MDLEKINLKPSLLELKNKKGQTSSNLSLSLVVEQKGVKSNYFGEGLTSLKA